MATNASPLLAGVRIVDFTWVVAGPLCTKWLAAWGAEVIKIESPRSRRDVGRSGGKFSPSFFNLNAGKLSLSVDMQHPHARELVKRLLAVSDVVVNNFTPDVLPRWGLSYPDLVEVNPRIISVSMPAMGSTGPHSHYKGNGNHFTSLAGFDYLVGYPDAEEVDPLHWAISDSGPNPFQTVTAILAALHYRHRTGKGQCIEVRQHEAVVNFMGTILMDQLVNGPSETRSGGRIAYAAPHGVFRCAGEDQWCAIAVLTDAQWEALCQSAGHTDWMGDPRFHSMLLRKAHEDELDALVTAWTSQHSPQTLMELLQTAGVPAGAVQNVGDLLERDPQMATRGFYVPLEHLDGGSMPVEGIAAQFSEVSTILQRAPVLGEHNDYVLQDLLGLAEEEVNDGIVEGAIQPWLA